MLNFEIAETLSNQLFRENMIAFKIMEPWISGWGFPYYAAQVWFNYYSPRGSFILFDRDCMKHAPRHYDCPFCNLASTTDANKKDGVFLVESRLFAFIPFHYYSQIKGNCLVAPITHYENIFDIPDDLGEDMFRVSRKIAKAMRFAFGCEGISTRQHNGPAGDQDVWHYHLHIFPRYFDDGLYGGGKHRYDDCERLTLADQLRMALTNEVEQSDAPNP